MVNLPTEYFLLVSLAVIGMLQIVAAYSDLRGLMFFVNNRVCYLIGSSVLIGAFARFVMTDSPSIPGDQGGIEGPEQFGLFLAGAAAATVTTAILASILQLKRNVSHDNHLGIGAFKQATLFVLLKARLSKKDIS